jgi:hypothetical protein
MILPTGFDGCAYSRKLGLSKAARDVFSRHKPQSMKPLALVLAAASVRAQVLDLRMADNFDRASLEGLERSAKLCAIIVSAAYRKSPDGGHGTFAVSPKTLQQLAFGTARSGPKVYGSAIAFAPGMVRISTFDGGRQGLEEGVRREANGYGVGQTGSKAVQGSTFAEFSLARGDRFVGKTIYCPYAFNCSSTSNSDEACSSMDLATAYDYSDPTTTWFFEPMRLFEEQRARGLLSARNFPAIWTEPYFDQGAGSINMTTYSVAFGTDGGEFLGVCTIDVAVDSLCWKDCSNRPAQPTTLSATMTSAQTLLVRMRKPTSQPVTVLMALRATGEHTIHTTYNLSMVWSKSTPTSFVGARDSRSEEWRSIDSEQMALAGHRLRWLNMPPSNDSDINLDAYSNTFAASKEFSLELDYMDCSGARPCIEDGDTIETVISIGSSVDAQSEVRMMTQVEALLSCKETRVDGIVESVLVSSTFSVGLFALDIDGLPINQTRAEVRVDFGDQNIPVQWSRGSNEYVATVPAELTSHPGHYDLVVSVSSAWNDTVGQATSCELLRRKITVMEGRSDKTQLVIALVLIGVVLVVLALGTYLLYKNRERAKRFVLSFLSFEGMLAADVAFEAWDAAGDGFFFFEVRKQSSKPWVSHLIMPYMIFFALACAVSLACMAVKSRLLVLKLRSRFAVHEARNELAASRKLSIGGVAISPGMSRVVYDSQADLNTIAELKSKFDQHRMHRRLALCHIASAIFEDVPMGTFSCTESLRKYNNAQIGGWRRADACRHHELALRHPKHSRVRRPQAHLRAVRAGSVQPRTLGGNRRPHPEHSDERSVVGLQGRT